MNYLCKPGSLAMLPFLAAIITLIGFVIWFVFMVATGSENIKGLLVSTYQLMYTFI